MSLDILKWKEIMFNFIEQGLLQTALKEAIKEYKIQDRNDYVAEIDKFGESTFHLSDMIMKDRYIRILLKYDNGFVSEWYHYYDKQITDYV